MEQLKIAMFNTLLPGPGRKVGGVDYAVHRLANELAKSQSVTVFSLSEKPKDAAYQHERLFCGWLAHPILRLLVLPVLLNFVNFRGFNILHLHGDDWFYFRRTCRTVRSMYGSALMEATTATSLRRKFKCLLTFLLEHISIRLATISLAVGKGTAVQYRLDRIADMGCDPGVFYPGGKSEEPTLLYVGTWQGRKRGSFIFDCFVSEIVPKYPTAKLHMVTEYCAVHQNVSHVSFPSDEELAQLFRESWIFAYPSVYEGFGIIYLEALASGTAIVCSPNEGASYVLDDGRYGLIVNDESFADVLLDVLQNDQTRSSLALAGLLRANRFTWSTSAMHHVRYYSEVLSS